MNQRKNNRMDEKEQRIEGGRNGHSGEMTCVLLLLLIMQEKSAVLKTCAFVISLLADMLSGCIPLNLTRAVPIRPDY